MNNKTKDAPSHPYHPGSYKGLRSSMPETGSRGQIYIF